MPTFRGTLTQPAVALEPVVEGVVEDDGADNVQGALSVVFGLGVVLAVPDGWALRRDGGPARAVALTRIHGRRFAFAGRCPDGI